MILSYRLIKPKWCSLLIGVFAIIKVLSTSFHMRPINQKMRHKRKRSPIHPKGANKPKSFRGCDLMHFGGNVSRKMTIYVHQRTVIYGH